MASTHMLNVNPKLIVLIEDDPLIIRMYDRMLRLSGYQVEMGTNGEEGITKLKALTERPVVVLLDIMMPKVNGYDVLTYIRGDERLKDVPVFMLSNLASKDDENRALGLGANVYMVKSQYTPKELITKIESYLSAQVPKL